MTGRLASAYITDAGKPQKIFSVPTGKVFSGKIVVFNKTGNGVSIQVKHGRSIADPTATFPFSNANRITTNQGPGKIAFDLGAPGVVAMHSNGTSSPTLWDLSDPAAPVEVLAAPNGTPRSHMNWDAPNRLCIPDNSTIRRYAGSVTPWTLGSYGEVSGGGFSLQPHTAQGWDQYAAAFTYTHDEIVYAVNVPTTGNVTWSQLTFASAGLDAGHSGYWNATNCKMIACNGLFFFRYPTSGQYQYGKFGVTPVANVGGAWTKIISDGNGWYCSSYPQFEVFYANGRYWFLHWRNSYNYDWYSIAEGDLFSQTGTPTLHTFATTNGFSNSQYGNSVSSYIGNSTMQLSDGRIIWRASNGYFVLDPVANTIDQWTGEGDTTIPANYVNYLDSKLNKVDIGTVDHTEPRAGTSDPDNDRIAYSSSGIYEFVSDDTWSLQDVTDDSGWIDYDLSLNNKAEVEYTGRMLSASDEIWVRSNGAGLTVSVEGFLLDAAA